MKNISIIALFSLVLLSSNARAHGIGPIDCNDWYKNPFVAVICGVGFAVSLPFEMLDYLDEKGLKKAGIERKEGIEFNEYSVKNSKSKFVIFNQRSQSLEDAKEKCASVKGRLATREESDLLDKGASHDADILYARLYLNYGADNKVIEAATTGFIDGIPGKDVFLYFKNEKKTEYHSSTELAERLNQSGGNEHRANFDQYGILQPVCIIE